MKKSKISNFRIKTDLENIVKMTIEKLNDFLYIKYQNVANEYYIIKKHILENYYL